MRRFVVAAAALLTTLAIAACEPSGPGTLDATLVAPAPTGAAVLEVSGTGIVGFEGTGDVRALSGPVDPRASTHRVVLVSGSGRALRFRIEVEDVGERAPSAVVVSAVDTANAAVSVLQGYSVRVSR